MGLGGRSRAEDLAGPSVDRGRDTWDTRAELASASFEWIEVFYNRQRRHSRLGYVSPVEFEQTRHTDLIAAA